MPVGDILEARIITSSGDQVGLNIRHYRISLVTAPEPGLLAAAARISDNFDAGYKSILSTGARFEGVGVRRIRPLPISNESVSTSLAGPGTVGGDQLPRQVAGIVTIRTALAGRRFRGRVYLPFPAESDNNASIQPGTGYQAAMSDLTPAFAATLVVTEGLGSMTLVPVIFSRRFGTTQDVTDAVFRLRWATQRRRGAYGRPNLVPPT